MSINFFIWLLFIAIYCAALVAEDAIYSHKKKVYKKTEKKNSSFRILKVLALPMKTVPKSVREVLYDEKMSKSQLFFAASDELKKLLLLFIIIAIIPTLIAMVLIWF
ncbi:MAG: hypothetical protein AAF429_05055 [Pseudomonadota bacterium]